MNEGLFEFVFRVNAIAAKYDLLFSAFEDMILKIRPDERWNQSRAHGWESDAQKAPKKQMYL